MNVIGYLKKEKKNFFCFLNHIFLLVITWKQMLDYFILMAKITKRT